MRTSARVRRPKLSGKKRALLDKAKEYRDKNNTLMGDMYYHAVVQAVYENNTNYLTFIRHLEKQPVSIVEFLDSDEFMGATDLDIWPSVRKTLIEINQYWYKGVGNGAYKEMLLTGGVGTAKTEISKITIAYHLHLLACLKSPQKVYGISGATWIVFGIFAAKPHVTRRIVYDPLRTYVEGMPWFKRNLKMNKFIESEMVFEEKKIRIVPAGADSDSVLGDALIGGLIDEINFMQVVKQSKRAEVQESGKGGTYDQAEFTYGSLDRRRRSRFIYNGPHLGMIIASSQARYVNDFTDRKKKELAVSKEEGVYVYDKAQFEVWPKERYCGDTFKIYIPDDSAASNIRVLADGEEDPSDGYTVDMPVEYRDLADKDPIGTVRDVLGMSFASFNPFIRQQHKVLEAISLGEEIGLESIVEEDNVIVGVQGLPRLRDGMYCKNPNKFRVVHVDLSKSGDACGVAMLRFDGYANETRGTGEVELAVYASVEMALSITPDVNNEIDFAELRAWIKSLKTGWGYPIKAVTYDRWGSDESRQAWKKSGMATGIVSVDKTTAPYKLFRDALYAGRIKMYDQPVLTSELFSLEHDEKKDKIDHPPSGSKDVADAVCAAYQTVFRKAHIWGGDLGIIQSGTDRYSSPRPELGPRR